MVKIEKQLKKGNGLSMAGFLKRRRVEMGLKLEELSSGICSISHLSRIENDLVTSDDNQYKALFEKMNIDYEQAKQEREKNVYEALLREYIKNKYDHVEDLINKALNSNSYCSIEVELMVLFYNTINQNYEEARKMLMKLEVLSTSFTNNELIFYLYVVALYAFNTNQIVLAYRQILVLTNIEQNNIFFKAVIYDLALDIMVEVNQVALAYQYFNTYEKIIEMPLFGENYHLHRLQLLKYTSDINYDDTIEEINKIESLIDLTCDKTKAKFYYYKGLILYNNEHYQEVFALLCENIISAKISSLLVSVLLKVTNYQFQQDVIKLLDKVNFTKYEKLYADYYQYVKLVIEGNTSYTLYNYLKNVLLIEKTYYDSYLYTEIKKEYLDKCSSSSKYKEGIKFIKRDLEMTIHQKLK